MRLISLNVLFLTIAYPESAVERNLYSDLMEEFHNCGHNVYVACTIEERYNIETYFTIESGVNVLRIRTKNITKNHNLISKGLNILSLERLVADSISKYFDKTRFDLILYSTPPITYLKLIYNLKKQNAAKTYLLLKDIFPQNAVDLGMMNLWSPVRLYFRHLERKLYRISDFIGCMSEANVKYLLKNNLYLNSEKIEVCPNSIRVEDAKENNYQEIQQIREALEIKENALFLLYGGNLGKPQGVDFLIEVLRYYKNQEGLYFLIIGNGSEYNRLKSVINELSASNIKLINKLPEKDYFKFVKASDLGLIFLDHRFSIPNFPSRILTYLQASKPVFTATDSSTDLGMMVKKYGCGFSVSSNSLKEFDNAIKKISENKEILIEMGQNAHKLLIENFTVKHSYDQIIKHF